MTLSAYADSYSNASASLMPCVSRRVLTIASTASGPFVTMTSAISFALSSACPSGVTRPIKPISLASGANLVLDRLLAQPHRVTPAPADLRLLTDREREVLLFLGCGRTNPEIAGELFIGEATVKMHVSHVLVKLALCDRTQAVVYRYGHGLLVAGG